MKCVGYPGVIAVDEELSFSAPFTAGDRRCVELVEDAALALRLGVQRVAAPRLGELFESVAGRLSDAEQRVVRSVRSTC